MGVEQATPTPAPGVPGPLGAVAYVAGGDIWIAPLPEGAPWRITFDGRNSEPEWSATGSWLAFRKENALWLIRPDGTSAHPFPNEGSAWGIEYTWSPVDDRLAFLYYGPSILIADADALSRAFPTSDDMDKMYLFQPDRPPDGDSIELHGLDWSPDGARLAFSITDYGPDTNNSRNPQYLGIWTIEATIGSTGVERYAGPSPPPDNMILGGWSPTGTSIYAWRDPGWSGKSDDGLSLLRLSLDPVSLDSLPYTSLLHADFTSKGPGGRTAFTLGAGRETWQNKRIAIFDPVSSTPFFLTGQDVAAISPDWSPDGSFVAYSAMPDQGASINSPGALLQRGIWVRDSGANSPPRQITGGEGYRDEHPQWSVDRSAILFARLNSAGRASVWLATLHGNAVDLTLAAPELTPSPDPLASSGHINWSSLYDWWRGK